jgi:hypothetical protein
MRAGLRGFWTALIVVAATRTASAQQLIVPGGELDSYLRFLALSGKTPATSPLVFRSPSTFRALGALTTDSAHPWAGQFQFIAPGNGLTVISPELHASYNSATPHGGNDGALWAGRGLSGALAGGIEYQLGGLTATLAPTLWYAQNRDFAIVPATLPGQSAYAYPFSRNGIDWPQRFGPSAITRFDWGQSGIRLNLGAFTSGISTENMWWGPSALSPIVMSSTAAGFPHLDLGIARPISTAIGQVEARLVYGRLAESGYFDAVSANDGRFLVGLTLGYAPNFLPGLTVGATRVFYKRWSDTLDLNDFLTPFQSIFKFSFGGLSDPKSNDDRDQILSIVARWVFPESGAEAYFEWARNDYSVNLRDFLLEPDHSRGYTIGFAKRLPNSNGDVVFQGEIAQLGLSATSQVRDDPTFYVHYVVRQGYSQLGQLIGAGIGPGGESEFLGVDSYSTQGRVGVFVQRVVHNADAYYQEFAQTESRLGHNVEILGGVSAYRFFPLFTAGAALTVGRELNRNYIVDNDVTNLNLQIWMRWEQRRGQSAERSVPGAGYQR